MDTEQKKQDELTLEESFGILDQLLEQLEDRETSLEDSIRLYEKGMKLLAKCNEKIDLAEKQILVMNGDGSFEEFQ